MVEIISKECVDRLPISAEPMSSWSSKTDLRAVLEKMLDFRGYSSYGKYLFEEGVKRWEKIGLEFQENANKAVQALEPETRTEPVPDFRSDPTFGKVAKYSIASDAATGRCTVRKCILF